MEEAYWLLAIISLTVSLLIVELDNTKYKKTIEKETTSFEYFWM